MPFLKNISSLDVVLASIIVILLILSVYFFMKSRECSSNCSCPAPTCPTNKPNVPLYHIKSNLTNKYISGDGSMVSNISDAEQFIQDVNSQVVYPMISNGLLLQMQHDKETNNTILTQYGYSSTCMDVSGNKIQGVRSDVNMALKDPKYQITFVPL